MAIKKENYINKIPEYYVLDFLTHLGKSIIIPRIDGRLWAKFHLGKFNVFPLGPYIPSFTIAQK